MPNSAGSFWTGRKHRLSNCIRIMTIHPESGGCGRRVVLLVGVFRRRHWRAGVTKSCSDRIRITACSLTLDGGDASIGPMIVG